MAKEYRLVNIEDAIAALAKARDLELMGDRETKFAGYLRLAEQKIAAATR